VPTDVTYLGFGLAGVLDAEVDRPFLVRLEKGQRLEEGPASQVARLAIGECHFFNGPWGPVTRETLREVGGALDRVEAHLNSEDVRERMLQRLLQRLGDLQVPELTLEEAWQEFERRRARNEAEREARRRRSLRLQIPETKRFPDTFYRHVAQLYLDLVALGERPVAALAEANGVPRSTVYTWIREARARGLMPPGRPGKAG
jgi:hypothetical protein